MRLDQVRVSTILIVLIFDTEESRNVTRGGEDRANQLLLSPPSPEPADKSQEKRSGSPDYHNNQIARIKISFE